jgi:hypothetical protein
MADSSSPAMPISASDLDGLALTPSFASIDLERVFVGLSVGVGEMPAHRIERPVYAVDLLRQMETAWPRTLLVSVDSFGGHVSAGLVLFEALTAVQRASGRHAASIVS